jgi:hypothetical protein
MKWRQHVEWALGRPILVSNPGSICIDLNRRRAKRPPQLEIDGALPGRPSLLMAWPDDVSQPSG